MQRGAVIMAHSSNEVKFDPTWAQERIANFWELPASFGKEQHFISLFLNEICSDRFALAKGMQLIRDELQFAWKEIPGKEGGQDVKSCCADFSLPSVVTTLASTNCGDRFNSEATSLYQRTMASRWATLSATGEYKMELFTPAGGGTDDGRTLAYVTVAHQLDAPLKKYIYNGNSKTFMLVNVDIFTHCGHGLCDHFQSSVIGKARESHFREPRSACGAIVGCLTSYDESNAVYKRLRRDLGEANFKYLSENYKTLLASDGATPVASLIASAIISVQGLIDTAYGMTCEMDERGLSHLTASIIVNTDNIHCLDGVHSIYLGRAIIFGGEIGYEGFGLDATQYTVHITKGHRHGLEAHLIQLLYKGKESSPKIDLPSDKALGIHFEDCC